MSSNICIKCAGRLHQLFDFNLIKTNIDVQRQVPIENLSEENNCEFCDGEYDIMDERLVEQVKKATALTKWSKVWLYISVDLSTRLIILFFKGYGPEDNVCCCYSCYNYLLLYSEIKLIMDQECVNFYANIRNWKVVLPEKLPEITKLVSQPDIKQEQNVLQENDNESTFLCSEKPSHVECFTRKKRSRSRYEDSPTKLCEVETSLEEVPFNPSPPVECNINEKILDDVETAFNRKQKEALNIESLLEIVPAVPVHESNKFEIAEKKSEVAISIPTQTQEYDSSNLINNNGSITPSRSLRSSSRTCDKKIDTEDEVSLPCPAPNPIEQNLMDSQEKKTSSKLRRSASRPIENQPESNETKKPKAAKHSSPQSQFNSSPQPQLDSSPKPHFEERITEETTKREQVPEKNNTFESKLVRAFSKKQPRIEECNQSQKELKGKSNLVKKRRTNGMMSFELQQLKSCSINNLDTDDKFSSIKKRRSSSRPIVLIPSNVKKNKFPTPKIIDETKQEKPQNRPIILQNLIIRQADLSSTVAADLIVPAIVPAENPITIEVPPPSVQEMQTLPEVDNAPTFQRNIFIEESIYPDVSSDLQEDTTNKDISWFVQETLEVSSQEQSFNDSFSVISGIDGLETLIPNFEMSLIPQLFDERNEMATNSLPVAPTDKDFCKLYNLKNCSISLGPRIDPVKLKKILGNRMIGLNFETQKKTKSGRVWKQRLIIDPSTAVQHRKPFKIKTIQEKLKKNGDKKMKNGSSGKVDSSTSAINGACEGTAHLKLVYPDDEILPEPEDIEEDFFDYTRGT